MAGRFRSLAPGRRPRLRRGRRGSRSRRYRDPPQRADPRVGFRPRLCRVPSYVALLTPEALVRAGLSPAAICSTPKGVPVPRMRNERTSDRGDQVAGATFVITATPLVYCASAPRWSEMCRICAGSCSHNSGARAGSPDESIRTDRESRSGD
jgi:hypothetical protein